MQDELKGRTQQTQAAAHKRVLDASERTDEGADAAHRNIENARQQSHERLDKAADSARDTVEGVRQKGQEKMTDAQRKIAETGSNVQHNVDHAHTRADEGMTASGQHLRNLSHNVRQQAPDGQAGDMVGQAADAMERGAAYLEESSPRDVQHDLERTMRNNPMQTLLVGVGVGFVLGRTTRRR